MTDESTLTADQYDSQMTFVGEEGQKKIGEIKVAIVGLSGTGSHVAQQLAYLGVRKFVLVDPKKIRSRNLNRIVGAVGKDIGEPKSEVIKNVILSIQPEAEVIPYSQPIASGVISSLEDRDIIFGCVDNDAARLTLLEASCQFSVPYLDIATEIHESGQFGGHVIFTGIGKGCAVCRNELDQNEIQAYSETDDQKEFRKKIYGVDPSALGTSGPSVVMLNGLLASAAIVEFVAFVTGVREPIGSLKFIYDNKSTKPFDFRNADKHHQPNGCYFCEHVYKNNGTIDLAKYS